MIGGEYTEGNLVLRPVIAPPLIIVGYLMMKAVTQIDWDDLTEAIPAFLTIIIMPMTISITDGLSFGFISYSLLKLVSGRGREVHWLIYLFSALFILRYILQ
jgi:AGZA family xanthine/uracil permease-like MFS transporter